VPINDVYQLTATLTNQGITCNNIFHFNWASGTDTQPASSLTQAFMEDIWANLRRMMGDYVSLIQTEVINLMAPSDYDIVNYAGTKGLLVTLPADIAPTFVSFGFKYNRSFPGQPTGHKRFTGVDEAFTAGNLYTLGGTQVADLEGALLGPISDGALTNIYYPVLVKRPYSLLVPPTSWSFPASVTYTNLTTQSSRKS